MEALIKNRPLADASKRVRESEAPASERARRRHCLPFARYFRAVIALRSMSLSSATQLTLTAEHATQREFASPQKPPSNLQKEKQDQQPQPKRTDPKKTRLVVIKTAERLLRLLRPPLPEVCGCTSAAKRLKTYVALAFFRAVDRRCRRKPQGAGLGYSPTRLQTRTSKRANPTPASLALKFKEASLVRSVTGTASEEFVPRFTYGDGSRTIQRRHPGTNRNPQSRTYF